MFKILVLLTLYTPRDDAIEFQNRDRLSCMRFLRMGLEDVVPDAKTIWLFGEQLTRAYAIKAVFADSDARLKDKGYLAMPTQIIDTSIIAAPR
jgi:IS5 family transposase